MLTVPVILMKCMFLNSKQCKVFFNFQLSVGLGLLILVYYWHWDCFNLIQKSAVVVYRVDQTLGIALSNSCFYQW